MVKHLIWLVLSILQASDVAASDVISSARQQQLQNLLVQDCGSCHGLSMRGGLGPELLPRSLKNKPLQYISAVILDGKPNSAMPAWRSLLSPAEANWIAGRLKQGKLE